MGEGEAGSGRDGWRASDSSGAAVLPGQNAAHLDRGQQDRVISVAGDEIGDGGGRGCGLRIVRHGRKNDPRAWTNSWHAPPAFLRPSAAPTIVHVWPCSRT